MALVSAAVAIDLDPHAPAEAFFAAIESAWNAADGERYGAQFADATDFVNIRGEHVTGDGALIGAAIVIYTLITGHKL